jgi:glyoxylase-like metal-dependent hydrolase (beta-lactamase superfamily II)
LYQTTTTVIVASEDIFVVDPNWLPDEIAQVHSFVDEVRGNKTLHLIFTHSDYDHIIGYNAFPGARVIASQAFADNPAKAHDVQQAIDSDKGHGVSRPYELVYPTVNDRITNDGQRLEFPGITFTFYLAPGHTDSCMFAVAEPDGVWIAGDYLSDIEFPLVNGFWTEYLDTLRKVDDILNGHKVLHLIPGHGSPTTDVGEILKRGAQALEYLRDIAAVHDQDVPFPEAIYRERYAFWDGIRDWHEDNVRQYLLQKS